jgi:hypothetical protein
MKQDKYGKSGVLSYGAARRLLFQIRFETESKALLNHFQLQSIVESRDKSRDGSGS